MHRGGLSNTAGDMACGDVGYVMLSCDPGDFMQQKGGVRNIKGDR